VKEQWFLVADEEVIELHVEVRHVNGKPEQVGSDFVNGSCHSQFLSPDPPKSSTTFVPRLALDPEIF
jgi:hypothetical protein